MKIKLNLEKKQQENNMIWKNVDRDLKNGVKMPTIKTNFLKTCFKTFLR